MARPTPNSPDGFAPIDAGPGEVDTLYGNAGIVTLRADRSQEQGLAFAAGAPRRKLPHFRAPGMGDAMWSGQCVYDIGGVSPSFSEYDVDDSLAGHHSGAPTRQIRRGVEKVTTPLGINEPTTTRKSRVAAHFDSAPAAAFFQGGFVTNWSGMFAGYFHPRIAPRPLHANFNPNQMGSKELHRATQYQPVPPMGSLLGYFGAVNDKAL